MRAIILAVLLLDACALGACAQRKVVEEVEPPKVEAPAPPPKVKIKYVYVKTPDTTSAMTIEPYEAAQKPATPLGKQVVQIFWPLLTLLAIGALMIVGLYAEHSIITRQLAKRAQRA